MCRKSEERLLHIGIWQPLFSKKMAAVDHCGRFENERHLIEYLQQLK